MRKPSTRGQALTACRWGGARASISCAWASPLYKKILLKTVLLLIYKGLLEKTWRACMRGKDTYRQQDVVILTQAIENVFRKLIRILVGRISLQKLQEMINFIYVEEAETKIKRERQAASVPLTKLALMTGLDSRTVASIRNKIENSGRLYEQLFLKELTPESAIVEAWIKLIDAARGTDKSVLKYGDENSGFETMVRTAISSRGITSQSIIQRLVASKSVIHDKKKKTVKLVVRNFSPYLSRDEPQIFNAAFTAISNLISTAEHNIKSPPDDKLFQRQVWTFRLPVSDILNFRKQMRRFLETMECRAKEKIARWEVDDGAQDVISAGVGFYYFEE
jgi:predicted regulator of amino acid metabolism with ACT domain